jgi:hypothetical protein
MSKSRSLHLSQDLVRLAAIIALAGRHQGGGVCFFCYRGLSGFAFAQR